MKSPDPISLSYNQLTAEVLAGEADRAVAEARKLVEAGVSREDLVVQGLEQAMERLDEKCTFDQFNLLEIMLAGRAVNAVMSALFDDPQRPEAGRGKVVLATLEGDVHDLGKKLVMTVLAARGFGVVDAGRNCSISSLVACVQREKPVAVGVSGLLTLVIPSLRRLRPALQAAGFGHLPVIAGGAALKQATAEELEVDFVAQNVFEGARYLESRLAPAPVHLAPPSPTPLAIVEATLRFEKTSRLPCMPQLIGHTAFRAGVSLPDYRTSGTVMAGCQIEAQRIYGGDAVFAAMDLNVEAEAMGAEIDCPPDSYANIIRHPYEDARSLLDAPWPDLTKDGRLPEILRAIRVLSKELGDRVVVAGWVLGPVTLASQLLGLEKLLFLLHDAPDQARAVLQRCAGVAIRFGAAQLASGAHLAVVFDPSSTPSVLPPALFRRFNLPALQAIFREFSAAGARGNWLHIAGPVDPILPLYREAGADLANFDYCVDPSTATRALPHTALDGNVRPLSFVEGTPDSLAGEVHRLREVLEPRGGWIVSSGCEIPPEARPENILAFVEATRSLR